jgi:hypothetical protein
MYAPPQPVVPQEPPEVQSIKSMLHIVRILAIIFGIILALVGIGYALLIILAFSACGAAGVGVYCGGALAFFLVFPILILIWGVVDIIIFLQMKEIEGMVDQHRYEPAKAKTLVWTILGFILGGIIIGVLLLIAYLKFDPVISWSRGQGQYAQQPQMAPQYGQPAPVYQQPVYQQPAPPQAQPAYQPAPVAAAPAPAPAYTPPPAAPAAQPAAPTCPTCQKPATFIAQYNRYYCFSCAKYV